MNKKSIVVIVAVLLIISLIFNIVLLLGKEQTQETNQAKEILKDAINFQKKLAIYVTQLESETFHVYTKEQLLCGVFENDGKEEVINDNEGKSLTPIIDKEQKKENGSIISYLVKTENLKDTIGLEIKNTSGISWYIQDGDTVKVHYEVKPDWWTPELDVLLVK